MSDPERRKRRRWFVRTFLRIVVQIFLSLALLWAGVHALFNLWAPLDNPWIRGVLELWTALLLGFFGALALGRWLGKNHQDPIGQINDAMVKIARGDFTVQVTPLVRDSESPQHDQLKKLADNLNTMAGSLAKMEDLRRRFVADVSHEFQSPLTSIQGFSQALRAADLPENLRQRYLGIIETEARRLSRLSENLLRLNSLDDREAPPEPVEFRLDVQVREVLAALEPQWAGKKLELEADLVETTVVGNRELWAQVWTNLVHNAVKFTPEGGRLSVTLSGTPAVVEVADSGIGLEPGETDRIFERFYKADASRTGTVPGSGLGLALVKRIAELHGAKAEAFSPGPGRGTVVRVTFPAA